MSDRAGYEIRAATEGDLNFVRATFLQGLYHGDSWFSLIPYKIFMAAYRPVLEALITRNFVWVACLKDDKDIIIGYSIVSADALKLHWIFVKKSWRNQGIGRALSPQFPKSVTHLTALGKTLLPKLEGAVFDPFNL